MDFPAAGAVGGLNYGWLVPEGTLCTGFDNSVCPGNPLLDTAGVVLNTFPVSVPAGQTASTNTSSLAVARNRTGTARFVHDGPPGAVTAEAAIANFSITPSYIQPVKFQATREAR